MQTELCCAAAPELMMPNGAPLLTPRTALVGVEQRVERNGTRGKRARGASPGAHGMLISGRSTWSCSTRSASGATATYSYTYTYTSLVVSVYVTYCSSNRGRGGRLCDAREAARCTHTRRSIFRTRCRRAAGTECRCRRRLLVLTVFETRGAARRCAGAERPALFLSRLPPAGRAAIN